MTKRLKKYKLWFLVKLLFLFFSGISAQASLYTKAPSAQNQRKIDAAVRSAVALIDGALNSRPQPGTRADQYKAQYEKFWAEYRAVIESVNYNEALEPEKDCRNAVAYTADFLNEVTLCPGFYQYGKNFMVGTLLHEMGHMAQIDKAAPGLAGVDDEECLAEQSAYGIFLLNGKGSSYIFSYDCKK